MEPQSKPEGQPEYGVRSSSPAPASGSKAGIIGVIVIVCVGVASFALKQASTEEPSTKPAASPLTLLDFQPRDLAESKCQIDLPIEPTLTHKTASGGRGVPELQITQYEVLHGGWHFIAAHYDKSGGLDAEGHSLAGYSALAALERLQLHRTSEYEEIECQGELGARVEFEGPRGRGVMWVVHREDYRVHVIMCCSNTYDPELGEHFLSSFNMYD